MSFDDAHEEANRIIQVASEASQNGADFEAVLRREIRTNPPHYRDCIADTVEDILRRQHGYA